MVVFLAFLDQMGFYSLPGIEREGFARVGIPIASPYSSTACLVFGCLCWRSAFLNVTGAMPG